MTTAGPARTRRPAAAVLAVLLTVLQAALVGTYVFGLAQWPADGGTPPPAAWAVVGVCVLALLGAVAVWRGTGRGLLLGLTVLEVLVVVGGVVALEVGLSGTADDNGFAFGVAVFGGLALVLPLLRLVLLTRRSVRDRTA